MDDIRTGHAASESAGGMDPPVPTDEAQMVPRRKVGPESEVRGGAEANTKPLPPKAGEVNAGNRRG